MLVRAVVRHEVDDDLQPELVRLLDEPVHVREGAEQWIDVGVVGDVVAEIGHRRAKEGRDPHRVDAEPGQVVQPLQNAREIADPVAVRVHERARVDLVDDPLLPPAMVVHPNLQTGRRSSARGSPRSGR
jgi:hypothetical protein